AMSVRLARDAGEIDARAAGAAAVDVQDGKAPRGNLSEIVGVGSGHGQAHGMPLEKEPRGGQEIEGKLDGRAGIERSAMDSGERPLRNGGHRSSAPGDSFSVEGSERSFRDVAH